MGRIDDKWHEAVADMHHLIEQGKSALEAAQHAFHRHGIPKEELLANHDKDSPKAQAEQDSKI